MKQHIVRTTLFGVSLSLKVDADPEHFERVVEYIEQKGQEVRQQLIEPDQHRISVLTNLLLADELLSRSDSRRSETEGEQQVDRIAQELIQLINDNIDD